MPLQAIIDSLEGLDEGLQGEYEATDDGRYQLRVLSGFVPADKVEDVSGLKSALQKEREANRTNSKEVRELREKYAGYDLDELEALRTEKTQAEEERAKKAGEFDKLKQQMVDQHHGELRKKDETIAAKDAALRKYMVDNAAVVECSKLEGNATLLMPHIRAMTDVVESENGEYEVRVLDAAGSARINGEGGFLSIGDLVAEMREQETFRGAFKGSGQSGGGTPPNGQNGDGDAGQGGTPQNGNLKRSEMSNVDKTNYIREHGVEKFMALPE